MNTLFFHPALRGAALLLLLCASLAGCKNDEPTTSATDASCNEDADCRGGETCEDGTCTPVDDVCTEDADCAGGQSCEDGTCKTLGCLTNGDCNGDQICSDNQCTDPQCTRDSACDGDQICREGLCEDPREQPCEEGLERCDGQTLVTCQDGLETRQECAGTCANGPDGLLCADLECTPNAVGCADENTPFVCDANGDATVLAACAGGQVCKDGACIAPSCEPFEIGCLDENTAFACDAEGFPTPLPCRDDQTCVDASCVARVCNPGETVCEGNEIVQCNESGTESTRIFCNDTPTCQENDLGCVCSEGACEERTCVPGDTRCVGNGSQTCNEDGTAWEAPETCAAEESCIGGLCVESECQPGGRACAGGVLLGCSAEGQLEELENCEDTGLICDPVQEACIEPFCPPGAALCDGNIATSCNAEGTDYEPDGIDCTESDTTCRDGACREECTPGQQRCAGGVAYVCNPETLLEDATPCADGEICIGNLCEAPLCSPGAPLCNGDIATTCNAEGSGYEPGGTLCAEEDARCIAGNCIPNDDACPTAIALGSALEANVTSRGGTLVIPIGVELELNGSASTDDNSVSRVEWRQLTGPPITITPSNSPLVATASDFLQANTRYVFAATAYDNLGQPSCEASELEVYTIGQEQIVAHLLWDTPGDPDQYDQTGADMDMHLLWSNRESSRWVAAPHDVFFGNRGPAWGASLDIDDTNGRGPEIITFDNPTECSWYHIAMELWQARFGESIAELRLFIDGQLAFDDINISFTQDREWLSVLTFQWPSQQIFPIAQRHANGSTTSQAPFFPREAYASELCGIEADQDACDDQLGEIHSTEEALPLLEQSYEGVTCQGASDFFIVAPETEGTVVLTADATGDNVPRASLRNLGVDLFDTYLLNDVEEHIPVIPGNFVIEVESTSNAPAPYEISAWLCADDPYSEFTSHTNAAPIEPGIIEGLNFCGGVTPHVFALEVGPEDDVTVEVIPEFEDAGDLDVRIGYIGQSPLVITNTLQGSANASLTGLTNSPLYIRIAPRGLNEFNRAALRVNVTSRPVHDLELSFLDTAGEFAHGDQGSAALRMTNNGPQALLGIDLALYLSADEEIGAGDVRVGALGTYNIGAGESLDLTRGFVFPNSYNGPTSLFLCAKVDSGDHITETDETNNTRCSPISYEPSPTLCSADFEPNESPTQAITSSADLLLFFDDDTQELCPASDQDTYFVDLGQGNNITICAENVPVNGEGPVQVTLDILNPAQNEIHSTSGYTACYTATVGQSGRYYVRVSSAEPNRSVFYNVTYTQEP